MIQLSLMSLEDVKNTFFPNGCPFIVVLHENKNSVVVMRH